MLRIVQHIDHDNQFISYLWAVYLCNVVSDRFVWFDLRIGSDVVYLFGLWLFDWARQRGLISIRMYYIFYPLNHFAIRFKNIFNIYI